MHKEADPNCVENGALDVSVSVEDEEVDFELGCG